MMLPTVLRSWYACSKKRDVTTPWRFNMNVPGKGMP
jgi:hypothetical protein